MGKRPTNIEKIDPGYFFLAFARKKFRDNIKDNILRYAQLLVVRIMMSQKSTIVLIMILGITLLSSCGEEPQNTENQDDAMIEATEPLQDVEGQIKDGLDIASGLIAQGDYLIVKAHCTACHSGKLVTQNRANREGWESMIRWMQKTQKLWELGDHEDKILDYLAKHYAPENVGRRKALVVEEWYDIEEEK